MHWIYVSGPPIEVFLDDERQRTSRFFQDVSQILDVKNFFNTTYPPQTNSQIERFDQTLCASLRVYEANHPHTCDLYNDAVTHAYNTQNHHTAGLKPFDLGLSRTPLPVASQLQLINGSFHSVSHYWLKWKTSLPRLVPVPRSVMEKARATHKRKFDAGL